MKNSYAILLVLLITCNAAAFAEWRDLEYYDGRYRFHYNYSGITLISSDNGENADYYEFDISRKEWLPYLIDAPSQVYDKYELEITEPPQAKILIKELETGNTVLDFDVETNFGVDLSPELIFMDENGLVFYVHEKKRTHVLWVTSEMEPVIFETEGIKINHYKVDFIDDHIYILGDFFDNRYLKYDRQGKLIKKLEGFHEKIALLDFVKYNDRLLTCFRDSTIKIGYLNDTMAVSEELLDLGYMGYEWIDLYLAGDILFLKLLNDNSFIELNLKTLEYNTVELDSGEFYFACNAYLDESKAYFLYGKRHYSDYNYDPELFDEAKTRFFLYNAETNETEEIERGLTSYKIEDFYRLSNSSAAFKKPYSLLFYDNNKFIKQDSALLYKIPEDKFEYSVASDMIQFQNRGILWFSKFGNVGYFDDNLRSTKVYMKALPQPESNDNEPKWTIPFSPGKIIVHDSKKVALLEFNSHANVIDDYEFLYPYEGDSPDGIKSIRYLPDYYYLHVEDEIRRSKDLNDWEIISKDINVKRIIDIGQIDMLYFEDENGDVYQFDAYYDKIDKIVDDIFAPPFNGRKIKNIFFTLYATIIVVKNETDPIDNAILISYDDKFNWQVISDDLPTGKFNAVKYDFGQNLIFVNVDGKGIYSYMIFTSVDEAEPNSELNIYPQPAENILNIELPETLADKSILTIYDLNGKSIYTEELSAGTSTVRYKTDGLIPGVYFGSIRTRSGNKLFKFTKE